MEINIDDRGLAINQKLLTLPFQLSDLETIVGKSEAGSVGEERTTYIWHDLGISVLAENSDQSVVDLRINLRENEIKYIPAKQCFAGELIIEGQNFWDYLSLAPKDYLFKDFKTKKIKGTACISKVKREFVAVMLTLKTAPKEKIDPEKYKLKPVANAVTKFSDFNFKLAVVEVLMYEKNLLLPKFDVHEFVKWHEDREIDLDDHYYELIPEVKDYFEQLPIPISMLEQVETIYQDGGNEIYSQLAGHWDGEDDLFNITSTSDLDLLPNLKKITLLYSNKEDMVAQFSAKGIDAEYL